MPDLAEHGGEFVFYFRQSSENANMKQMRKRACDFSPFKGVGVGGERSTQRRLEGSGATVGVWCSLPAPCFVKKIFFEWEEGVLLPPLLVSSFPVPR